MSEHPTTTQAEPASATTATADWNDAAELHKCADGGGIFNRFMTIRRGTFAELIAFVMDMPEDQQGEYAIEKEGDHRFSIGEIRTLSRRSDFPVRG